jgi:tyrosyl-DNA phosphodiesterase-1
LYQFATDEEKSPTPKRLKLSGTGSSNSPITLSPKSPISPKSPFTLSSQSLFYLSHVRGLQSQFNDTHIAVGIRDILSPTMGDLVCSAQFNYLIDIPWLLQQYPPDKRKCPLLIVHGEQRDSLLQLRKEAQPYPNVQLFQAKLEIMFGTHHSKMMLLAYREGLRVVIHTANLIQKDWDQKTQGVWLSPLFPPKDGGRGAPSDAAATKDTGFQRDLLAYLAAYGGRGLDEWKTRIREHDLSSARVHLIASVPGAHVGDDKNKWGHLKLRKVLSNHCVIPDGAPPTHWPVVGQFSSVGSLGPSPSQWLASEWLVSLSSRRTPRPPAPLLKTPPLKLVFPSVENVRCSLEGYMAGGSIPYASQTAAKQPYLRDYLHQWKAEGTGRSRAAPHIKTYMRISPNEEELAWILITSANLSKAAWGALEKKGSQLKVRSYEIGVLFLPSDHEELSNGGGTFSVATQLPSQGHGEGSGSSASTGMGLVTPFDLPLTPYTSDDQPWVWNIRHMTPDCKGNVWTPP